MEFLNAVEPFIDLALKAIIPLAVGWLAWMANRWFGMTLDAGHRAALETALTNAAGLVRNKLGKASGETLSVRDIQSVGADRYVEATVPDALKHFGLQNKDAVISEKVLAKVPQVPGPAPTVVVEERGGAAV